MSEHITKLCPKCRAPMEIKVNRETGKEFLGCSAYRTMGCAYTQELPEDIRLRRAGQKGLFDE